MHIPKILLLLEQFDRKIKIDAGTDYQSNIEYYFVRISLKNHILNCYEVVAQMMSEFCNQENWLELR